MTDNENINKLESLGIEKLKSGELAEAVKLFREAICLGSSNFNSRLLLTRALVDMERESRASEFYLEEKIEVRKKK
jgi:hypothetical protein